MDSDEQPGSRLGENLRRMFLERGLDFFDQDEEKRHTNESTDDQVPALQSKDTANPLSDGRATESIPEAPSNMRLDILPQLQYVQLTSRFSCHCLELFSVALGEMTLAKDVLSLYAASTAPASVPPLLNADATSVSALPDGILASSSVSQPPSIASVQSFNAHLVTGGKDEALRKASDLHRSAAIAIERSHDVGARYWIDALKTRRRNWGLTPAPLPFGMSTGRGADRTTKDFLISFGLSECMSLYQPTCEHLFRSSKRHLSFVSERLVNSLRTIQRNQLYSREDRV
jgi:mediator of RNA polymerase II transcription subunit 17, fungi type